MRVGDRVRLRETTPWRGRTGAVLYEVGYPDCPRGGAWEVLVEDERPFTVVVFGDESEVIGAGEDGEATS